MNIVLIDNYDSFTYNLVHLIESIIETDVTVIRNDKLQIEELTKYDKIVLSPGPGVPKEAGLLLEIIKTYVGKKPLLGVCLGHQAIAEALGGSLINLDTVFHGVATDCKVTKSSAKLLQNLNQTFTIGRYHSWVVDEKTLPTALEITAVDENGQIMAMQHKKFDVHSVQFHPESILTPEGKIIMGNFLSNN